MRCWFAPSAFVVKGCMIFLILFYVFVCIEGMTYIFGKKIMSFLGNVVFVV